MARPAARARVPATTANLGAGFDAFGAALAVGLEATVAPREGDARVTATGEGAGELPEGDENLVWRAFVALHDEVGEPVPDVAVTVHSAIPLERGLGSSSAALVAGLGLARALVAPPVGDRDLVRLAAAIEGHPDNVAPAVLGGLVCAARDDDGALVLRRVTPHRRLRPVLLVPSERQPTVAAREVVPDRLPRDEVVDQTARGTHVFAALAGSWPAAPGLAGDRLHEPARAEVMPAAGRLLDALRAAGVHAWLSGAGPAVVAAVARRDTTLLATVGAIAADHDVAVIVSDWDLAGLDVRPDPPDPVMASR
jgi:homoserine kinase